jgi:hypothetical protein
MVLVTVIEFFHGHYVASVFKQVSMAGIGVVKFKVVETR